ncbi:MAG: hypothetical protein R2774_03655 [Saprospiraceae bacterium]
MSELRGGKFIHGFAAGSISSVTGSLTGGIKLGRDNWAGPLVQVVAGGIAGGISASIAGGRFAQGFALGVIVNIMNHQLHAAGVEQVEPGEEEPPKCGDKVTYKGKYGEVSIFEYTGDGPYGGWTRIFYIGPYNAIQVTDSPIDWIIGAWKTPLQAADDLAVLGFAKFAGGKSFKTVSESYLKKNGIPDIHEFKQIYLGETAKLQYFDVAKHTLTHELLIIRKSTQEIIEYTGKFIK